MCIKYGMPYCVTRHTIGRVCDRLRHRPPRDAMLSSGHARRPPPPQLPSDLRLLPSGPAAPAPPPTLLEQIMLFRC
jgi:hypothetical protein